MRSKMTRLLIVLFITASGFTCYSQQEIDPLIIQGYKAYADRDLKGSKKLFLWFLKKTPDNQNPDTFQARMGLAYLYILSAELKNVPEGRRQLKEIIENSRDAELRGQALYLLGRSFHLERGNQEETLKQARVYYKQYLEEYPQGNLKSLAILYMAKTYLRRVKGEDVDKAIGLLETFFNSPEGQEDEYAAELALALGDVYQMRKNDMNRAVEYLIMALDKGLAGSVTVRGVLSKIAFIYDKRLHQPKKALKYYRALVEQFPIENRVNVYKKRIKEIVSGHEGDKT